MNTLDPHAIELSGLQLIEASAGTGKTFNLAGLYLRLIVEKQADVRDILVMTFTNAATQELRERIRKRLDDAARLAIDDVFFDAGNPEHAFAARLLRDAAEDRPRLARRLKQAADAADEATIVTLNGFAQRAVADHAFDSALAFDRGEIVDDKIVFKQAAADVWRGCIFGPDARPELLSIWATPDDLLNDVRPVLSRPRVLVDDNDADVLDRQRAQCRQDWQNERDAFREALIRAHDIGAFKKSAMKSLMATLDAPDALVEQIDAQLNPADSEIIPILPDALMELAAPASCVSKGSNAKKACIALFEVLSCSASLARLTRLSRIRRAAITANAVRKLAAQRKLDHRQFSYDDQILTLHDALHQPGSGPHLARALHAQWPWALIDEFQDTAPLQYASLARIYPDDATTADNPGALLLIGDPKQAIYAFRGGDIHAYLAAARAAGTRRHTLATNFRSSQRVLDVIAAMFNTPLRRPFLEDGIDFPPVSTGRDPDERRLVDDTGRQHPALTVWQLSGGSGNKTDDGPHLIHQTIATVARLLSGPWRWQCADTHDNRRVAARDIAILVNSNKQAAALQTALAGHGIAAVCQRKDSVFATNEAHELRLLLVALARPDDLHAVRSAETTLLAGAHLADIIHLADNDRAMQACSQRYQDAHRTWRRHGILTALEQCFIGAAPRVLALTDGERRMSNYLQLGDLLARAEAETYDMIDLIQWLHEQIATADDADNDNAQLRLESDDELVRITTVHSAKGLEYPIVLMPYAPYLGVPNQYNDPAKPPHVYHDTRSDHPEQARIDLTGQHDTAKQRALLEYQSEALRLLYVGLTRAAEALFISWREIGDGEANNAGKAGLGGALHNLLGHDGTVSDNLRRIEKMLGERVSIHNIDVEDDKPGMPTITRADADTLTTGRTDLPTRRPPWASFSFSRLASAAPEGGSTNELPDAGAEDERDHPPLAAAGDDDSRPVSALDPALAGVRFGSAVHDLLEQALTHDRPCNWPAPDAPLEAEHHKAVRDRLRRYGLIRNDTDDFRIAQTADLVRRTLHAPLPDIGPLAGVDAASRITEMEFMLQLGGSRLGELTDRLQQAGYLPHGLGGQPQRLLNGLMQGFIDLIVERDGRYFILDYKTNNLGGTAAAYQPAALQNAIDDAHYDLQYLIYTTALHRHLQRCLDNRYDPDTHLGGVQYLFVRGMNTNSTDGIYRDRPDISLIRDIAGLFANEHARSAGSGHGSSRRT